MRLSSKIKAVFSSLTFFILVGMILGLVTGGFPGYTSEISTVALMIAMILSLTNVKISQLDFRKERKNFLISFLLNFGFLSSIILLLGLFFPEELWNGFVVMAAVPPAIMVAPLTRAIKGNVKLSFFSLSTIYLISILFTPVFIFLFSSEIIDIYGLLQNILLLIVLPLLVSRLIMKIKISEKKIHFITNICFFILVFSIMGKNQGFILYETSILVFLFIAMFVRTFVVGSLVLYLGQKIGVSREDIISFSLFASFKNEGLALLIAFSLFNASSSVPPAVALITELIWVCCLEWRVKK